MGTHSFTVSVSGWAFGPSHDDKGRDMTETRTVSVRNLYGGARVLINGEPLKVWSVSHGVRTVRVTFDVAGQRKADSRVTYTGDATVTVVR